MLKNKRSSTCRPLRACGSTNAYDARGALDACYALRTSGTSDTYRTSGASGTYWALGTHSRDRYAGRARWCDDCGDVAVVCYYNGFADGANGDGGGSAHGMV